MRARAVTATLCDQMSLTPSHALRRTPRPSQVLVPGHYVTDGRRLFRVISKFSTRQGSDHVFASLEDCLTLETHSFTPGELSALGLRPVRHGEDA
ncbi:MAG: hypothetical protein ACXVSL_20790 [Solirubrobacteraceae bacterium]